MGKIKFHEQMVESRKIAWEAYAQAQGNNEIPAWIVLNGGTDQSRIASDAWTVRGYLFKQHVLPPGMTWERRKDGSKELVSYDLETGQRGIIISYDVKDEEFAYFFDAEVDLSSRTVIVKHSIAVNDLRPENFMLHCDNFDLTKIWRFDQSWEQNRLKIFSGKSK